MGPNEIVTVEFNGLIWQWRGPAPFYFVTVPDTESEKLKKISKLVTYGWGMIPVTAKIGETEWKTALFPQKGNYVVPIKSSVRKAQNILEGDKVEVTLTINISY